MKILKEYLDRIDKPDKYYVKDLIQQKKFKTAQKYLLKKNINTPVLQWLYNLEKIDNEEELINTKKKILKNNKTDKIEVQEILEAEKILSVKFHPDYLWILKRFRYLDDDKGNVISGLSKYDQSENILFLNKKIIDHKELPSGHIVISYDNKFHGLLVLNNFTGEVFLYSHDLKNKKKIFNSLKDFIKIMFH